MEVSDFHEYTKYTIWIRGFSRESIGIQSVIADARHLNDVTHLKISAKRTDILLWTKQGSKLHFPHFFVSP